MSKITTNAVEQAAKQIGISDDKRRALLEMLLDMTADENEGEKPPAVKKQFAILISDPLGQLPKCDFVGWVLQIPENESVMTTEERVHQAAYDFNCTKKGRLLPVQTVGEACENVKAKHFREHGVWVKTKTPVLMLRTNNEIPKTDSVLGEDRGSPRIENMSVEVRTADRTTRIDADGVHKL